MNSSSAVQSFVLSSWYLPDWVCIFRVHRSSVRSGVGAGDCARARQPTMVATPSPTTAATLSFPGGIVFIFAGLTRRSAIGKQKLVGPPAVLDGATTD